jgi:hypothetical protein
MLILRERWPRHIGRYHDPQGCSLGGLASVDKACHNAFFRLEPDAFGADTAAVSPTTTALGPRFESQFQQRRCEGGLSNRGPIFHWLRLPLPAPSEQTQRAEAGGEKR